MRTAGGLRVKPLTVKSITDTFWNWKGGVALQEFPKISHDGLRRAFLVASMLGDLPDLRPRLDWPCIAFGWAYTLDCDEIDTVRAEDLEAHVAERRPYRCEVCGLCHRTKQQAKDCCDGEAGVCAWEREIDFYGRKGYGPEEMIEILGLSNARLKAAYDLWRQEFMREKRWGRNRYNRFVDDCKNRRLSLSRTPKRKRRARYVEEEA